MALSRSSEPIVLSILAANGQQSSGIIAHLLSVGPEFSEKFHLRAIVRDPSKYVSPNTSAADSKSITNGVDEVVRGDMNDENSMQEALKGTDVLWFMTTSDPEQGIDAETRQGKMIVDTFVKSIRNRASPKVKPLLLFSSAIDAEAVTKCAIKMINATGKAKVEEYVRSLAQSENDAFSFTFVHPGMFMQNFLTYQRPTIDETGVYHFTGPVRPDVQIPFVDIQDLGPLVWHLLKTAYLTEDRHKACEEYNGASVRLYGQYLSYPQIVDEFSVVTGKAATYDYLSLPKFLSTFFGGTEESARLQLDPLTRDVNHETMVTMIGDMYNLINRYGYYGDGISALDAYGDDINTPKVIFQQSTRRTTWKHFVRQRFCQSAATDAPAAVLSLPANFPNQSSLSKAEKFLYKHLSYFLRVCQAGPDAAADFENDVLQPHFSNDAVVEFPYCPAMVREHLKLKPISSDPTKDGAILYGYDEILNYFKNWQHMFWFSKGELRSLSALSSSASERLATPEGAVIEVQLSGKSTLKGQWSDYVQDYVCFAYLDEDGKVVRYREYWEPAR